MNIEIIKTADNTLKEKGFGCYSSCLDVLKAVKRAGNIAQLTVCESLADLDAVVARNPDFVVLAAKYIPVKNGYNIWFSDYFSKKHIVFSGSDRETLKFDCDNGLAKIYLGNMGINTARHFTAMPKQFLSQDSLPLTFPLFVKSIDALNGNGIDDLSFVNTFAEFEAKVLSIYTLDDQPALVEEYLPGREFKVAIICNGNGEMKLSSMEMLPAKYSSDLRILGQKTLQQKTEIFIEGKLSDDSRKVTEFAKSVFLGLGLRGFGRIDVRMNKYGQCFFMKANLVPCMAFGTSYFPKACEIANNLTYDQVICLMIEECSNRAISEKTPKKVLKQRNLHWPLTSVAKIS